MMFQIQLMPMISNVAIRYLGFHGIVKHRLNVFSFLYASINSHIGNAIAKINKNPDNIFVYRASIKLPCSRNTKARDIPHPGQGIPVINRKIQGIWNGITSYQKMYAHPTP